MPTNIQTAIEIFKTHRGILRNSEAQKLGIHPQTLARMVDRGLLTKEERGLYQLADNEIEADPDLINVAKLVPKGVFCLLTALSFHKMTTQIPRKVYVALPFGYKSPVISHPPLDIINLEEKPYKAGIENHNLGGIAIPIYCEAKTVTDCFKFRRKIGENVAIEALKDYLGRDNHDIQLLLKYAAINRVKKVIEPYLKALI
jgi:predicted transcriptional regulator of viral defense system